jgi:hypothetical protein
MQCIVMYASGMYLQLSTIFSKIHFSLIFSIYHLIYYICVSKDVRIRDNIQSRNGPVSKNVGKHCTRWKRLSKDMQKIWNKDLRILEIRSQKVISSEMDICIRSVPVIVNWVPILLGHHQFKKQWWVYLPRAVTVNTCILPYSRCSSVFCNIIKIIGDNFGKYFRLTDGTNWIFIRNLFRCQLSKF